MHSLKYWAISITLNIILVMIPISVTNAQNLETTTGSYDQITNILKNLQTETAQQTSEITTSDNQIINAVLGAISIVESILNLVLYTAVIITIMLMAVITTPLSTINLATTSTTIIETIIWGILTLVWAVNNYLLTFQIFKIIVHKSGG